MRQPDCTYRRTEPRTIRETYIKKSIKFSRWGLIRMLCAKKKKSSALCQTVSYSWRLWAIYNVLSCLFCCSIPQKRFSTEKHFLARDPTLRITFLPCLWAEWNADTAPGKHKIRRKTPVPIYAFTQEQPRTYLQDLDTLWLYCSLTTASSYPCPLLPPQLVL